jgi:uncharacterized protein
MGRTVGIGWREELGPHLLAAPRTADLVELLAEGAMVGADRREARALAEIWPLSLHGVKLSLGSAEGIDRERVRDLGRLARDLRPRWVSEHLAFVRARGVEIGHLIGLPFTREAVRAVARNVAEARRRLPDVPFLLENVAWSFRWRDDAMDEGDFHHEVTRATGCPLLLDVANVYANARNAGRDPRELLGRYPLDRVAMVHVAGGRQEGDFYFDTHAHPVPAAVLALVAVVLEQAGEVPVVLEHDAAFPPFAELQAVLDRVRAIPPAPPRGPVAVASTATASLDGADGALADQQARTSRLLVGPAAEAEALLARARQILERKRAHDARDRAPNRALSTRG